MDNRCTQPAHSLQPYNLPSGRNASEPKRESHRESRNSTVSDLRSASTQDAGADAVLRRFTVGQQRAFNFYAIQGVKGKAFFRQKNALVELTFCAAGADRFF